MTTEFKGGSIATLEWKTVDFLPPKTLGSKSMEHRMYTYENCFRWPLIASYLNKNGGHLCSFNEEG